MAKIKIMDPNLANKIAAGEVVERPYSVVKELVENALDAGSTKLDVILEDAGLRSIKIIDNGSGMDAEDAFMAFNRHATSKLLNESELFRIHTLGFRGEALPSIASVSDVTLTTSTGDEAGTFIHIRGGQLVDKKLSHARKGTEICVNSLFYNTPARLKYLKAINTELGYSIDYLNKMAISHPHIAFRFVHDGRVLLQTNGNNQVLQIVSSIYGLDVAKKMNQADYKDSLVQVNLYFSEPEVYRTSRHYITLVVNNRVIKNSDLVKAIIEGYEGYLPISRYPIVVVDIKIDSLLIDVNVHPAKLEIRFSNNDQIKTILTDLIRKQLKAKRFIPKVSMKEPEKRFNPFQVSEEQQTFDFKEPNHEKNDAIKRVLNQVEESKDEMEFTIPLDTIEEPIEIIEKRTEPSNQQESYDELKEEVPKLYYIGQLRGTFLLAQNDQGLYLIDQHAAEERINYEYYLTKFSQDNKEIYELLVPQTFEFSLNEAMMIEDQLDVFKNLHIEIEKFGLKSFIVTKIPNWFLKNNDQENLELIFKSILEQKNVTNQVLFNELAVTLSCKRSIKANHYINANEVQTLLDRLVTCENPYRCPHGRPVIVQISFEEIEYMFKRTV